ncbi:aromatic acid exporter family protein [Streptomonospora sp. S1-112]|uniref:Aromatic acid exporter family protein n=1 Tax=Streptomonospora mangrovi TaxID=2883123 RepID=A0A9X3NHL9_9ACTN|nr:aromatic acid exporter family protein [Streptomonospora mangrovi]MDA0563642.1 aromatic acid exporter family protein [Streptomonospora mangrovi]
MGSSGSSQSSQSSGSPRRSRRPSERTGLAPASIDRWSRARQWLHRARSDGHERNVLLMIAKSTLAATIAWAIAYYGMRAQAPAFAPFSAVLMMQVTVYQSVAQSLRYLGAVVLGVALQGVFGFLAGSDVLTFALVALGALVIGRWPRLGSQGSQVATAAFFAFSMYVTATTPLDRLAQLGQIVLLVCVGCGVGVLVNLLVLPPMRFRSAEYGVRALAHVMCDLISDMHPPLREGSLDEERTAQWRSRANNLGRQVDQARSAVRTAEESVYYNPRRLLRRNRGHTSFTGYAEVVDALDRVGYQLASVARTLDVSVAQTEAGPDRTEFLGRYADFLASAAEVTRDLGEVEEERLAEQTEDLCRKVDQVEEYAQGLADHVSQADLPLTDRTSPYATLLVDATRLQEEFQYTCDVLRRTVEREAGSEPGEHDEHDETTERGRRG